MPRKNVSFLAPEEKIGRLDALANSTGRDRSFYLNEAIDLYLELNAHHTRLIEQGIADADAGRLVSHQAVGRALTERRRRRSGRVAS